MIGLRIARIASVGAVHRSSSKTVAKVFDQQADGWSGASAVHAQHDARRTRPSIDSQQVGDLVDGSIARLRLGGESLRKFAAVTLATGLEFE